MNLSSAPKPAQCPRCGLELLRSQLASGSIDCMDCGVRFEATIFQPPVRPAPVLQTVGTGPAEANQCANHERNAAVTSCQRCGLFICALCNLDLGSGSYCPSCFERMRAEGALAPAAKKYRDYASLARISAVAGLFLSFMFLGIPAGGLAIYYGIRGIKQRRAESQPYAGTVIVIIVGALELFGGLLFISFLLWSLFTTTRTP